MKKITKFLTHLQSLGYVFPFVELYSDLSGTIKYTKDGKDVQLFEFKTISELDDYIKTFKRK